MSNQVLSMVLHSFETDNRVLRSCRSLIDAGYEVTVVALQEGELPEQQRIGNIAVERIRLWSRGWPKWRPIQLLKYTEWMVRVTWRFRRFQVAHCNDLNTLPAGVLLKAFSLGKSRVIYDAHEFESNHKSGQSRFSVAVLQLLEGALVRFADEIVTVSPGIADEYARIYPIKRPSVVMNCQGLSTVDNDDRFRRRFNIRPEQTIFLTQGWLRPNRGIECMLETFSDMDASDVLVVMGRGQLDALVESYARKYDNIFLHPVVPPEQVLMHTVCADYGLALIHGTSFSYQHCLPNKLFEYIMAGLPVIVSDLPEMRRVVAEMDIGVVCPEISPTSLRQAIESLKSRSYAALESNLDNARQIYNWEEQERIWLEVVRSVSA